MNPILKEVIKIVAMVCTTLICMHFIKKYIGECIKFAFHRKELKDSQARFDQKMREDERYWDRAQTEMTVRSELQQMVDKEFEKIRNLQKGEDK